VTALRVKVGVFVRVGNWSPQLAEIVGAIWTQDHIKDNPAPTPVNPVMIINNISHFNHFQILQVNSKKST
jgi:hypothetical protein